VIKFIIGFLDYYVIINTITFFKWYHIEFGSLLSKSFSFGDVVSLPEYGSFSSYGNVCFWTYFHVCK